MGKANRPLVVRIKPGESVKDATLRALQKPSKHKRNLDKVIVRMEPK